MDKHQKGETMRKFFTLLVALCVGILGTHQSLGQLNISVGNTITEDFSIGTSATATLPSGWKVDKSTSVRTIVTYAAAGTATELRAGDNMSSTATNGIYNYAAGDPATATDRAVGWISLALQQKAVICMYTL